VLGTSSTSATTSPSAGSSTSWPSSSERIHILDGFATIFDALDETIRIIRASDGKADAAGKIIKRFKLDEIQVDAILELKLYKLAKLEINVIREELARRAIEAKRIDHPQERASCGASIKGELQAVAKELGTPRRTKTAAAPTRSSSTPTRSSSTRTPTWSSPATAGSSACASSRTRRQTRVREGDEVMACCRLDQGEGRSSSLEPRLGLRRQDQRHRGHRPATATRRRSTSSSTTASGSSSAMSLDPAR
jgi:DNA gyrase/topoisomerase IV subunit A